MARRLLPWLGLAAAMPAVVLALGADAPVQQAAPAPETPAAGLLAGCGDVPEAVALAHHLTDREKRVRVAVDALEARRLEIDKAVQTLEDRLRKLHAAGEGGRRSPSRAQQNRQDDVARLVAVYEAMKSKDAAAILANLPPEFSAELLMRVGAETGARIIAAIPPEQAAILTTYMGARSAAAARAR